MNSRALFLFVPLHYSLSHHEELLKQEGITLDLTDINASNSMPGYDLSEKIHRRDNR